MDFLLRSQLNMIIKIDNSLIDHIVVNKLENDPDIINSINSFLRISQDKVHLVLVDILLIDFIRENFEQKIDKSCFEALNQIRNKEIGSIKTFLRTFPIHINVVVDAGIQINEVRVSDNIYYENGKIFEVNFYSLRSYSFLGEKVSILSEQDTDVDFYSLIGKKYLIENHNNLVFEENKITSGFGGNIKKQVELAARNNEKTLIICDTDKITHCENLKDGCTLEQVENEFRLIEDKKIVHLVSLEAHEKENLIPVSWLQELNNDRNYCENILKLEDSDFNDRLLFLDFKKGLTKEKYLSAQYIKDYYEPAINYLSLDVGSLNNNSYIFSRVDKNNWNEHSIQILHSKNLKDYPAYLKGNIEKLGLYISCWLVSGRNDFSKAKDYV